MEDYTKDFIKKVEENYPKNKDKILSSFEFANNAHDGILRKSGEPYIIHPVAVAEILMDNDMDYSTVMAGLLHDVVEDTKITLNEIEQKFGKVVAKLVDGVTKIDAITLKKDNLTEDDSIKRLLLAMGDDVRVIFIKLADRLHNMRTIEFLSPDRQFAMAKQTQELFIPIAERIGVRKLRAELQLLSFKILHAEEYEQIKKDLDEKLEYNKKNLIKIEDKIKSILSENKINAKIVSWPEKYYSIYKKSKSQDIKKASGLMMFKIVVDSEDDCYRTLGIIHKHFRPLPGQITDYIASPKANGYKSLHSIVLSTDTGITFNVMIRTAEMDRVCEYGILAIENSKDSDENFNKNLEKLNILKEIISGEKIDNSTSTNFIDAIKTDLSTNVTWVFTPKMKPVSIETSNPTVLDFAYAVHTKIGNNAVSALINGKKASLGSILKNGDTIEILTSDEDKAPSRNWLYVVKTYSARRRIREYFNKNLTKNNIELGKQMLGSELEKYGYNLNDIIKVYPQIKLDFGFSSIDDMYASVGYKGVTILQIAKYVIANDDKNNALLDSPVFVKGVESATEVYFSKCCCPVLGDEIVAVKSKNNISIHTKNCLNLKKFDATKIFDAIWKDNVKSDFEVNLKIVAKDSVGIGSTILGLISKSNFNMTKLVARKRNTECEFDITLMVKNLMQINNLIENLKKVEDIKSINRSFD